MKRGILSLLCLVSLVLSGSSVRVVSGAQVENRGPVTLDAQAQCPLVLDGSDEPYEPAHLPPHLSWMCKITRYANGITDWIGFDPLKLPWGIDYAYNCGSHAGMFKFGIGNTGFDTAVSNSGRWLTGREGRGTFMETKDTLAPLYGTPPFYRTVVVLYALSGCAWHLRAVRGNASVVSRHVPPLPNYRPWRIKFGRS